MDNNINSEKMICGKCYKYINYIGETSGKCIKLQRIVHKDDKCHSEFPVLKEQHNNIPIKSITATIDGIKYG